MSEEETYFIRHRGKVKGPYSVVQLKRLVSTGQFSKVHEISADKRTWEKAEKLTDVFSKSNSKDLKPEENSNAEKVDNSNWYYAVNENRLGPVNSQYIINCIREGMIKPTTLVWKDGFADWTEAQLVFPEVCSNIKKANPWLYITSGTLLATLLVAIGIFVFNNKGPIIPTRNAQPGEIVSVDLQNPEVNEQIKSSVGMIVTYLEITKTTGEKSELALSHGSGFLVDSNGTILTNKHVTEEYLCFRDAETVKNRNARLSKWLYGGDEIKKYSSDIIKKILKEIGFTNNHLDSVISKLEPKIVAYFGSKSYELEEVYSSNQFDLSVMRGIGLKNKYYFSLCSENEIPQLTDVVSLGFPGVAQIAFTKEEQAILDSKSSDGFLSFLEKSQNHMDSFKQSALNYVSNPGQITVIQKESKQILAQHSAIINHGNSGGPLVIRVHDQEGIVYGINTQGITSADIYIAYPVAQMRAELEEKAKLKKLTWRHK